MKANTLFITFSTLFFVFVLCGIYASQNVFSSATIFSAESVKTYDSRILAAGFTMHFPNAKPTLGLVENAIVEEEEEAFLENSEDEFSARSAQFYSLGEIFGSKFFSAELSCCNVKEPAFYVMFHCWKSFLF